MLKSLIILPDGTELSSGIGTVNALRDVKFTQCVNAGTELTLGSVCADMLEATLLTPGGQLNVAAGTEVAFYKVDESGNRTKMGLFTLETPTRPSANTYRLTAYDRVSWLDRDLTQWLAGLTQWPYSLLTFAQMVCNACGLVLKNTEIPNGDFQVPKFSVSGITGRRLMQWVAEACGRFCRATADGELELAWYTPAEVTLHSSGDWFYYGDSLRYEDYQVAVIDKVQIRQNDRDVGASYGTGNNVYHITGNILLISDSETVLNGAAKVLYDVLQAVSYTPCRVSLPVNVQIRAGDVLQVTDRNGKTFSVYVMNKVQSGHKETLECTGSAFRDSTTEVNNARYSVLSGKVMELQIGMDGLQTKAKELDGRLSSAETAITQSADEISLRATKSEVATVEASAVAAAGAEAELKANEALRGANEGIGALKTEMEAKLSVMSDEITMSFQKTDKVQQQVDDIQSQGVSKVQTTTGYTFDETGFTVSKSGREMKTQITEDGMTVYKNDNAVLTANNEGVDAVNLHASTFLIIGGKSRFEKFSDDRIGCFWIA